jgi:acetyl esterase/lipase
MFGGCGTASADESGATGSGGGSASNSAPAASSDAAKKAKPADQPTATDGTGTSPTTGSGTPSPKRPDKKAKPESADEQGSSDEAPDPDGADPTVSTDPPDDPSADGAGEPKKPKREHVWARPKVAATHEPAPPSTPTGTQSAAAKPATAATAEVTDPTVIAPVTTAPAPAPNVVAAVATAVSTVASALLTPLAAGNAPEAPATQPQLWTLLAFARREMEHAFAPPSSSDSPVGDVTAARAEPTAAPEAAAQAQLAADVQVAPVVNSLTYTGPPNLIDQVTVLGLRVLRTVSTVIGVDLFAQFNKLLISKEPPFYLTFGLHARQTEVELSDVTTWKVWEFQPSEPTDKTVIAIHGSGFIYEPNLMQWYDYTSMARDTGATVLVPIYPLATTEAGSALNVVPDMADFIGRQIAEHGADNVSVYGDSAGSIIAIAAVRQLVVAGSAVPSSMVLLSLTPDGSLSNPDIQNTDDPVVDVNHLGDYATTHWGDGLADVGTDPRYNALSFETLVGLPPTTIYVGSTEFVLPDTLLLYQKAVDEGAPISVVVGQGQIHDWPLGGLPINSQAPGVRRDVYRQLGLI